MSKANKEGEMIPDEQIYIDYSLILTTETITNVVEGVETSETKYE
jgi:hypothetical protein